MRPISCLAFAAAVAPLILLSPARATAQVQGPTPVGNEIFVDSEAEKYLRLLQVAGEVPLHPWSLRGFSSRELQSLVPSDSTHPWRRQLDFRPRSGSGPHFRLLRSQLGIVYNTGFPYGENDGLVWAGRGMTASARLGAALRYGPLSLVVAPEMFWTQNGDFELEDNGREGELVYADARFPGAIDHPQRFGDGAYGRLDPGQSTLRLDLPVVTLGLSTANQFWGPADRLPLLLGSNAPGFRHVFVGTSAPLDLWLGKVHTRLTWGQLQQSPYSPMEGEEGRRLMAGLVALFTPRGLDGLEMGVARFYHMRWPSGGPEWAQLRRPLESFLKAGLEYTDTVAENQLASVFGRWVLPRAGLEVFGEFAREDHSWDFRDFVMEPDHNSGYMLGMRRIWQDPAGERITAFRAEWANTRRSHLMRVRGQGRFYTHSQLLQGHTQRGQLLATEAAFNGSGAVVGIDRYDTSGRWSLEWSTVVPQERSPQVPTERQPLPATIQAVDAELLRFLGGLEASAGLSAVLRVGAGGSESHFNLRGRVLLRAPWPGQRPQPAPTRLTSPG